MLALTQEEYEVLAQDADFDHDDDTTRYEAVADRLVARGLLIHEGFENGAEILWTYEVTLLGEIALRVSKPSLIVVL